MAITGGCRCGAVRYALAADTLPLTYACHCRDCQTWSGSAFSQQALMAEDELTVTAGAVERFEMPHPSGTRVSHQRVCGRCHTRLWNTNTARPGIAVLRAGNPRRQRRARRRRAYLDAAEAAVAGDRRRRPELARKRAAGGVHGGAVPAGLSPVLARSPDAA